jgi:hypothetical protein
VQRLACCLLIDVHRHVQFDPCDNFEQLAVFELSLSSVLFSNTFPFLDSSAKLRKGTISFFISLRLTVRPSVRSHETSRLPLDGFSLNLVSAFGKSVEKIQI